MKYMFLILCVMACGCYGMNEPKSSPALESKRQDFGDGLRCLKDLFYVPTMLALIVCADCCDRSENDDFVWKSSDALKPIPWSPSSRSEKSRIAHYFQED